MKSSENNFFEKYLDQPLELPENISEIVEEKILLFSFWDLDENFQFVSGWIVISESHLCLFKEDVLTLKIKVNEVDKVLETSTSSINCYEIINSSGEFVGKISFTNRQKQSMSGIKYLLEEVKDKKNIISDFDSQKIYEDAVLKNIRDKQNINSEEKLGVVKRLLSYLKPYKKDFVIGAIGAIGSTIVALVPAYISGLLIDDVVKAFQNGEVTRQKSLSLAFSFLGILVGVYLLREVFRWIRLKKMSIIGEKVASDLRRDLYDHLQSLDLDFYSKRQTGSIISRVSSDTDRIWDFVAFGIVEVGIAIIMLLCLSIVLVALDLQLGLLMTIPVPFIIYSIYLHGKKMEKIFIRCWRKWSALTDVLSDTIPGIQVVKAFNQQDRERKRFNNRNEIALNEFEKVHHIWTKFWPRMMMAIHFLVLMVWALSLPRLLASDGEANFLSAGTFVSFLLYMTMFSQPIEIIGQMARMLNRATSSALRIFEILDTKSFIKQVGSGLKGEIKGNIEFKDVFFTYDGVRQVLKGVNLKINSGEMIGLVGPSGGGKTTISKLMFRFYDANAGSILIDNKKIEDLDLGNYRQQVGMVLQDPFLFHGSIADNISYGMPAVSKLEIIKAAKIANAHEFIMKLSEGYETVVGERGQSLSGGEKQRVSIARAILHNPKILILDEATSAVDTETESKIQDALNKLIEGRTVIAIAHRLSTVIGADRIVVLDGGEVSAIGPHSELLTDSPLYARYAKVQLDSPNSASWSAESG